MRELCPLSLELTFRLIAQAKEMTLKQCFVRDFQVIEQMVGSPDFREGVRCVLLEKGQTPKWTVPDLKSLGE
jgi:enoyl-CoA hydratase